MRELRESAVYMAHAPYGTSNLDSADIDLIGPDIVVCVNRLQRAHDARIPANYEIRCAFMRGLHSSVRDTLDDVGSTFAERLTAEQAETILKERLKQVIGCEWIYSYDRAKCQRLLDMLS